MVTKRDKHGISRVAKGYWAKGQSGNPRGRPPMLSPEMRERLDKVTPELFEVIIQQAKNGDMQAAKLLLDRAAPVPKQTSHPIEIEGLSSALTLSDKAQAVVEAVGDGICPPDTGAVLIQAIAATAKIIEVDEIQRRLDALEEAS